MSRKDNKIALGLWSGGSNEAWYDFEKLSKYRKRKNPEWVQKYKDDPNIFYIISVDIGRIHDSTVATVFRVNKTKDKFYSTVVNIFVLGRQAQTKTFSQQAIDIKLLIERYNPREVLIDCNGLGRRLCSSKTFLTAGKP